MSVGASRVQVGHEGHKGELYKESLTARAAEDAEEEKSLTAKDAKDAEENDSHNAKAAENAKVYQRISKERAARTTGDQRPVLAVAV